MKKNILLWMPFLWSGISCASGSIKETSNNELHDSSGRKIGYVQTVSFGVREYTLDQNQDNLPEKRWRIEDGQMTVFQRYDTTTGKLRSESHYFQGKLNRVHVFAPDGSLRGIVNYPDGKTAQSVELPKKGKIVEFMQSK